MTMSANKDATVIDVTPIVTKAAGGGLEGAERTSRETYRWSPAIISPDQQINPVKDMADARARDSVQNDGYATGAMHTHRDSIVGAQFVLNAQPNYEILGADEAWAEEFQTIVEGRFNLLAESEDCWFDASGMNTFTGLVRLAVGGFMMTGEVLASSEWLRDSLRPFRTAIQMIAPARLSNPDFAFDDRFLRRGIKRDVFGKPEGYWIRLGHPGSHFYLNPTDEFKWVYVPARKPWGRKLMIHIIEQMQPDQSRGVADMVAVLKSMRMTKKFQDVTLQNAVVNASYAAAVESELPREVVFGSLGAGQTEFASMLSGYMTALQQYVSGSSHIAIDGVKMPHLFPGTKLNLKPMGTPGGVGTEFEEALLRHTAAALGLSYEQFSKDYSKTNYSSARASMVETWKFMQGRKKSVADRFAKNVYTLWLEEEINKGNIPLPKGKGAEIFYDPVMREALCACDFIGASRGQIDELKETQAAVMRINSGLSTAEIEISRLGYDYRKIYRQAAKEQALREKLGLAFSADAVKPGQNDAQNTMRGADGQNSRREEEEL